MQNLSMSHMMEPNRVQCDLHIHIFEDLFPVGWKNKNKNRESIREIYIFRCENGNMARANNMKQPTEISSSVRGMPYVKNHADIFR